MRYAFKRPASEFSERPHPSYREELYPSIPSVDRDALQLLDLA
jgi:hypothetical protein